MASRYQKRHYIDIAKLLNRHIEEGVSPVLIDSLVYDFVAMFGRDNSLFNSDTFKRAVYDGSSVDLSATVHIPFTNY